MFRSVYFICLVYATCVFSWHLKERESDARTIRQNQPDAIDEPKQSEVNSHATKTESAAQDHGEGEATHVSTTNTNKEEPINQHPMPERDLVGKTIDKIKGEIDSTQESLTQTGNPTSVQRVNEDATSVETTEHSESGGIAIDDDDHTDFETDGRSHHHADATDTQHDNTEHGETEDINKEPASVQGDNIATGVDTESHNTHSHVESTNSPQPIQTVIDNMDASFQTAVNDEVTSHNTHANTNNKDATSVEELSPASDRAETMSETEGNGAEDTTTTQSVKAGDNGATRDSKDVDPLNIFVDDIKFQRFPAPMDFTTFQEKVEGNKFKKLYILEETDKKLFATVRQLNSKYKMENDTLFVNFEYRFIFSRACQKIKMFRVGDHVPGSDKAYFEKDLGDGVTERVFIFSESPDDYVFFMSCTDRKQSPYACRDTFYVTLDSAHDPPNQFPWLKAAQELKTKMNLSFEDPRFVFNFVMTPCA